MNYRHHFHAGNFSDVMKHVLLLQLFGALQKKEKGLLYLDTHAGRGSYDLSAAARGDTRTRMAEWPDGIGRLWSKAGLSAGLREYVELVRQFDHDRGNRDLVPCFYPGSPWLARFRARSQDRLSLCEKHPEEYGALTEEFRYSPRTTVQLMDGYIALRAALPPIERRALVLIDPAYELQNEFQLTLDGLREGLARLPSACFAIWYPLTERARVEQFFAELSRLGPPATLALELTIAGERAGLKMSGCGLVVINPPWHFDSIAGPLLNELADVLAQDSGGGGVVRWIVTEK